MKKLFLFFAVAMLVGCTDYTDDFNTINNRLDALEQSVPSIEEQIESINAQLTSLKATDDAIKEQIEELENSNKATATEIADLKKKDLALEKSINDLQNYVDTQITNAKSEAAAAYATIEQYNTIVAQLNALQSSTSKLGEELTAKINAEVKSLTDKIADLEARLKAVEDKVENLLARIQSVSYIPEYADGKVVITRMGSTSSGELSFRISPKDAVVELEKVWSEALSCEAFYPKTRAVSLVKLAVTEYVADAESGVITVKVSGEGLSDEFFAGTQEAKVALVISDGNNQVVSDYADMVGKEVTDEIWYKTTDGQPLTPNHEGVEIFGANIVSNTYENGKGVIKFDGDVTQIGEQAFYANSSTSDVRRLTTITIPNSVTSIGTSAFYSCSSLTSVTIPDSVTSIENRAFLGCSSLTNITIPDSVISIEECVFLSCNSLTTFYGKFASADNKCLIVDGLLNSFAVGCGATEYTIPDSVTSIGTYAFSSCTSLTSVTIPNSVIEIGHHAFSYCKSLTSITIPNSVTSIGYLAFYYCNSLTSITIPNSVTSIGESAFRDCTSLTSVYCKPTTPPAGNYYMFSDNASGRKIYVPRNSVSAYKAAEYWKEYADYIEGYDFENGEVAAPQPANNEIWYTSSDGAVVTPYKSDVFGANIVSNTYENGKGVITFDGDVTLIGDGAFTECTSLTSLTMSDSISNIGELAFLGCCSLTNITIPNSVSSIGECAFYACTSLTSVSIPNSVISFGHSIFAACESLEAISGQFVSKDSRCLIINGELNSFAPSGLTTYAVPYSVTSIGYYAFCGCSSLTSITIPDSVTSLENRSFWFCTSLASITIPNGVTKIGENAFYNCSSLTSVYCKSTTPPIGNESMFNDNASERKIYVPHNSVEAYKTAEYWSNYASDIVGYDF